MTALEAKLLGRLVELRKTLAAIDDSFFNIEETDAIDEALAAADRTIAEAEARAPEPGKE